MEGPIPKSIFQLTGLEGLYLSGNRFNGTLDINEILPPLKNLTDLDLSGNEGLSIDTSAATNTSFSQLGYLSLSSCNLSALPEFLRTQANLWYLDLSNTQIQGTLPSWIWNISKRLNLSRNNLVDLEPPIPYAPSLGILDLHSNNLQGELPSQILGSGNLDYLDCSSNNFTSINPGIGDNLTEASFLSLAGNHIYGTMGVFLPHYAKPPSWRFLTLRVIISTEQFLIV